MGAPVGNTNATKNKPWTAAINRALAQDPDKLRALAEKLIGKAIEGDMAALKELGDRVEGKPGQSITLAGDPENPIGLAVATAEELRKKVRAGE